MSIRQLDFLILKWTAPTWWMICYWFFFCPVHWPSLLVLPAPGRFCTELQYLPPSLPFPVNQMYSKMKYQALNNNMYKKTKHIVHWENGKATPCVHVCSFIITWFCDTEYSSDSNHPICFRLKLTKLKHPVWHSFVSHSFDNIRNTYLLFE